MTDVKIRSKKHPHRPGWRIWAMEVECANPQLLAWEINNAELEGWTLIEISVNKTTKTNRAKFAMEATEGYEMLW